MRFSRQEYWSGLPFPSPGDLSDPGIEPKFPSLQADALPSEPPGKPIQYCRFSLVIYFIHSSIYIYVYPNLPIPSPTCPLVSIHLFSMSLYFYLEPCLRALTMPANLENSAVATGLEKVGFHSNPKERQCQRILKLPHNCTHLTH